MTAARTLAAVALGVVIGAAGVHFWPSLQVPPMTAAGRAEAAIRSMLYDPDSARIKGLRNAKGYAPAWCGEVNAKNRFGAMVGFRRVLVVLDSEPPEVRIADDSASADDKASFEQRYLAFCY